jgi:hypothetical protein
MCLKVIDNRKLLLKVNENQNYRKREKKKEKKSQRQTRSLIFVYVFADLEWIKRIFLFSTMKTRSIFERLVRALAV